MVLIYFSAEGSLRNKLKTYGPLTLPCVVPLFTISTRMLRYTVRFTEVSFIEVLFHVFNITMILAQGKAFKLRKTSISFF